MMTTAKRKKVGLRRHAGMTNEEVVMIAHKLVELDKPREQRKDVDLSAFEKDMPEDDRLAIMLAYKLLSGRGMTLFTDNPRRAERLKGIADHLGAISEDAGRDRPWGIDVAWGPERIGLRFIPLEDMP